MQPYTLQIDEIAWQYEIKYSYGYTIDALLLPTIFKYSDCFVYVIYPTQQQLWFVCFSSRTVSVLRLWAAAPANNSPLLHQMLRRFFNRYRADSARRRVKPCAVDAILLLSLYGRRRAWRRVAHLLLLLRAELLHATSACRTDRSCLVRVCFARNSSDRLKKLRNRMLTACVAFIYTNQTVCRLRKSILTNRPWLFV